MDKTKIRLSKTLSRVLRHDPVSIGLHLDAQGWADVSELLKCLSAAGYAITRAVLNDIVAENDKQRFCFSDDLSRIRANQGHSIEVDLGLVACEPPKQLFHGTAWRHLDSIKQQGLLPGKRQQVHLSVDQVTARRVGMRHGKPVIIPVKAQAMHQAGYAFYLSDNGVWLCDQVPVEFLDFAQLD